MRRPGSTPRHAARRIASTAFAAALAIALSLAATACRGGGGAGRSAGAGVGDAASPREVATGGCLGPFCLGRAIAEADRPDQAAAIASNLPPTGVTCWRFDQVDVAAFTDTGEAEARVRGVLATAIPSCGTHPALASATTPDVADCRGVRLGDPAAFVTKMHRQARPVTAEDDLWPGRPAGVAGLSDICTPGADSAHRTLLYLQADRVVGIGIGRR